MIKRGLFSSILLCLSSATYAGVFDIGSYSPANGMKKEVLNAALKSLSCANKQGHKVDSKLAIIDFSKPSNEKRLWILDLETKKYILEDYVSHGKNSGDKYSNKFSNVLNSYQSSIGLFKGSEPYYGRNGYSLRLDGLERGWNDKARERNIVIHSASYVDESFIKKTGRAGRSHGCPAVSKNSLNDVIDNLKDGQYIFKYYPDQKWLKNSTYLNC